MRREVNPDLVDFKKIKFQKIINDLKDIAKYTVISLGVFLVFILLFLLVGGI